VDTPAVGCLQNLAENRGSWRQVADSGRVYQGLCRVSAACR
jgi:hypothetical protein